MNMNLKRIWGIDKEEGREFNGIRETWDLHDKGIRPFTRMRVLGSFSSGCNEYVGDVELGEMDHIALIDSTAAQRTVTLPSAGGIAGRQYVIKVSAGANDVIVDGNGSETIDGASAITLPGFPFSVWLVSDGSNWLIL